MTSITKDSSLQTPSLSRERTDTPRQEDPTTDPLRADRRETEPPGL